MPHVKTHKTGEIVSLEMQAGIHKHKCATVAEARCCFLRRAGCADCLSLDRAELRTPCAADAGLSKLSLRSPRRPSGGHHGFVPALSEAGMQVDVLLDIDVGQHRTGIAPWTEAAELYEMIRCLRLGLRTAGLHVYDGHDRRRHRGAAGCREKPD